MSQYKTRPIFCGKALYMSYTKFYANLDFIKSNEYATDACRNLAVLKKEVSFRKGRLFFIDWSAGQA